MGIIWKSWGSLCVGASGECRQLLPCLIRGAGLVLVAWETAAGLCAWYFVSLHSSSSSLLSFLHLACSFIVTGEFMVDWGWVVLGGIVLFSHNYKVRRKEDIWGIIVSSWQKQRRARLDGKWGNMCSTLQSPVQTKRICLCVSSISIQCDGSDRMVR